MTNELIANVLIKHASLIGLGKDLSHVRCKNKPKV